MYHHGQSDLPSRSNVRSKALTLPIHVVNASAALAFFHLVIVQTCFAYSDHPRQAGFLNQIVYRRLVNVFVVWVNTHRAPEVVVSLGQSMHIIKLFHGCANAKRSADVCICHFLTYIWQLRMQFGKRKVAMGIGVHVRRDCSELHALRCRVPLASSRH